MDCEQYIYGRKARDVVRPGDRPDLRARVGASVVAVSLGLGALWAVAWIGAAAGLDDRGSSRQPVSVAAVAAKIVHPGAVPASELGAHR